MIYNDLYEVQTKDESSATVLLSDKQHPVFKAHFPMKPVLPGFVHFEIVSDVFGIDIQTIKKAKFMKMVLPKQIIRYERVDNKFKVFHQDEVVASFSL